MRRLTFGNFEPGSASGVGCLDCGLGELLPVLATPGFQQTQVDQYDALASGRASGGNFERFKDGAELGWFTNDKAGYANYLAYNTLGLADARFQGLPSFVGWVIAGNFAYAVVAKMHVGNALSPIYDVPTAQKNGIASVLGVATNQKWGTLEREAALQAFADNFPRLLTKWGYKGGTVSVQTPVMIKNPYFESLGQTVWVDKNTVTYDGPDDRPDIVGGRMFSAGGVTWRWGGTMVVVPAERYLEIIVDGNNPANPPHYDERQWTMYPTLAWFVLSRGGRDATGKAFPETRTPLTKWTGEYLNYSDTGPKGSLMFFEQLSAAEQAAVKALGGSSTPPSKLEWGWGKNTNLPTGMPPEVIPITDPRNPNYKPPTTTVPQVLPPAVKPWTDVAVPPPTAPSPNGSQPIIPPGVPPVTTSSGALVPSVVGPGLSPDVAADAGPVNEMQTAGVDAGSIGKGMGVALLGGLAVLMLLSKKGRRR